MLELEGRGHVTQCPIAGDATGRHVKFLCVCVCVLESWWCGDYCLLLSACVFVVIVAMMALSTYAVKSRFPRQTALIVNCCWTRKRHNSGRYLMIFIHR